MNLIEECSHIIECLEILLSFNLDKIISGHETLILPIFSDKVIRLLCSTISEIFLNEPILLEINDPIIIIGDIHGQLLDLIRIFFKYGLPPKTNYLFLGDIVDRGEFSLECLIFIYSLKFIYPNCIYIIRGNHEFLLQSSSTSFGDEIQIMYPHSSLFHQIIESFYNLPLAAILFENTLCIHGGISPEFHNINQIKSFQRPIKDYSNPILMGLLWSDPTLNDQGFLPSRRGTGFLFGYSVLNNFLIENKLEKIIRGHECIIEGFKEMFNGELLTVFSASNYCGVARNNSAIIFAYNKNNFQPITMLPLR